MKYIIKNATLISMSENREKIEENIDIKIDKNKITKIGKNLKIDDLDKIIDASRKNSYARTNQYTCTCANEHI